MSEFNRENVSKGDRVVVQFSKQKHAKQHTGTVLSVLRDAAKVRFDKPTGSGRDTERVIPFRHVVDCSPKSKRKRKQSPEPAPELRVVAPPARPEPEATQDDIEAADAALRTLAELGADVRSKLKLSVRALEARADELQDIRESVDAEIDEVAEQLGAMRKRLALLDAFAEGVE